MKKIITSIFIIALLATASTVDARGGGGRAGGGARSGSIGRTSATTRTNTTSGATTKASPTPTKPAVSTRPVSGTTKTVTAAPKTVGEKTYSGKGYVVDQNYQPRFRNGYTAPAGSVVYYRDNSFLDYLPLYYLMTHDGSREAVVVSPDGKEEVVKEEGTDGMYVFNWIITILLGLGLIFGIVYLVNKFTKKKNNISSSYV